MEHGIISPLQLQGDEYLVSGARTPPSCRGSRRLKHLHANCHTPISAEPNSQSEWYCSIAKISAVSLYPEAENTDLLDGTLFSRWILSHVAGHT